jgi:hypothetical protein
MFVTFNGLEGRVPTQALNSGFQYWGATVLPKAVPWYLANIRRRTSARQETVFVACESMLVDLLNDLEGDAVVSLMRFDADDGTPSDWKIARVEEVWWDCMLAEGERLFFKLQGEATLRDTRLQATAVTARGWMLARIGHAPLLAA